MLGRFLAAVTMGRTAVFLLPLGLFFVAADAAEADLTILVGLAGAMTVGGGVALWPSGRLLDRIGAWRGLRLSMAAYAVGLATLAGALGLDLPAWIIYPLGTAVGTLSAPLRATPRALLTGLVDHRTLTRASGLEAASAEAALLAAPLLAVMLAAWGADAVLGGGAVALAGSAVLLPHHPDPRGRRPRRSALLTRGILGLASAAALVGFSGGLLEPALAVLPPPIAARDRSGALFFVAISAGSLAGGLVAARWGWPRQPCHAAPLLLVHGLFLGLAAHAGGVVTLLVLAGAGIPFAPLVSLAGLLVDDWVSAGRRAETLAIIAAAVEIGQGIGQAIAARMLTATDARTLLVLSAVSACSAGAGVMVITRR